jgi:predicted acylesterase/phospholipase RssA/CRP-like cAMP-binding protein
VPFGILALLAARRQLVESRAPGRRRLPDVRGALLLAAALACLTLGLVQGPDWGWDSAAVVGAFVASAVLTAGFVVSSRVHPSPLLDPTLLRIRAFGVGNVVTVLGGAGFYAYLLTNILWLRYVWGYSVLTAGLALVPGALVAAVTAAALGPVAQKHGYRWVVVPGAVVWALAYVWYYVRCGPQPEFLAAWLPGQILSGLGVGATLPVVGSAALAAVPGGRYATASAVVSSARQVGGVLGIALLVVIIGTPTGATAATDIPHGWLLSVAVFAGCAVVALALGPVRPQPEEAFDQGAPGGFDLPSPRPEPVADGLAAVPFLARLDAATAAALEDAAGELTVPAGEWLFRAGDEADGLYLVRSGRLDVLRDGAVVRSLGPGTAVGELALLSGGRRSADVRARRDTHLLALPRAAFDGVMAEHPSAPVAVAGVLAEQLASGTGAETRERPRLSQPSVVAVVGAGPGAPAEAVGEVLAGLLARHVKVAVPGRVGPDGLARAEAGHDRVVLVAGGADDPDGAWRAFCLRQADQVVLVARTDSTQPGADDVGPGAELVLVGPTPADAQVSAWAEALDSWQVTLAETTANGHLVSLADRLAGRSVGLVLAGGGARAFAHLGVLVELEAAGIRVDRIAGTSIGAIVAACYATGMDAEATVAACYEEFVRHRPFSDYTLPRHSVARGHRARAGLLRQLGDRPIEALPRQFRCVSTDLGSRTPYVHRRGPIVPAVAASFALPGLFPPAQVDGRLLVDGGLLDNLPVDTLSERDEGPLVAVNIAMGGNGRRPTAPDGAPGAVPGPRPAEADRPPRLPALGETLLRSIMIGSRGAVDTARSLGAVVITPPTLGVGLLEFHQLDRMVEAGRMATRDLLDRIGNDLAATLPEVAP